jgi:hypothetical protein
MELSQMKRFAWTGLITALLSAATAAPPVLVDPETGKYLGTLSDNPYDPDSTGNPYGRYGSRYSPDSINNPYGRYGSPYSPDSPYNRYAPSAPVIIDPQARPHR